MPDRVRRWRQRSGSLEKYGTFFLSEDDYSEFWFNYPSLDSDHCCWFFTGVLEFLYNAFDFFIKWKIFNWTATRNYTWFQDWDSFMYIWILLLLRQPLADAEGAKKFNMMELLKAHGGLSYVSPITNASFLLLDVCMLHDEPFVSSIAFVSSDWDSASCRVKMEVTLNQSQSLPLCQTSVTGKLTLLSWTSQPRQLLGRWGATLISED